MCQYWSAYVAAAIVGLMKECRIICETTLTVVKQNDGDFLDVILL